MTPSSWVKGLSTGATLLLTLATTAGVRDPTAQRSVQSPRRILVGPNVRVSRSSNDPRVELMIAANPTNAKNLIATSIVSSAHVDNCAVYASLDAGNTWTETIPAGLPMEGSGDPTVAFGTDGAAYFSALGRVTVDGRHAFSALLFRSEDGGLTWRKSAVIGAGEAPDREQLAPDPRRDHAGDFLVSAMLRNWRLALFRSRDGGQSFTAPTIVTQGAAGSGVQGLKPIILSDGTIVMGFRRFQAAPLGERNPAGEEILATISRDGGHTFSTPQRIASYTMHAGYRFGSQHQSIEVEVDATSGRFRDHVYLVWSDAVGDHYRVRFSRSTDRGATWSAPRALDNGVPASEQIRPAIAVNKDGVVGVSWFDSRVADGGRGPMGYDEFFAASFDGASTFQPGARVSRVTSTLHPPGNAVLKPTIDSMRRPSASGELGLAMSETDDRFPDSGDYQGLTADASGDFHPFWSDTRTGSSQAWTATIKVGDVPMPAAIHTAATSTSPLVNMEYVLDPARVDRAAGVEEIPVRLRNSSDAAVCGSLIVQIRSITADHGVTGVPQILNSGNGLSDNGAEIDYSRSLGDFPCLDPGAVTDAVVWKVKIPDPTKPFMNMSFVVVLR